MATSVASPACSKCGRLLPVVPGTPPPDQCRDQESCARRAAVLPPPPAPAAGPCAPATPSQDEVVKFVGEGQRGLAIRALTLTHSIMAKMEEQIRDGVDTTLKDGTVVTQPVQPMALSAMLRELRPVVQEPVRVKEASDGIGPPLQLNTNNPAVVAAVIKARAEHRDAKKRASNMILEGEVVSDLPDVPRLAERNDEGAAHE